MTVIVLFILALSVILVPFVSTESDTFPCVICNFLGVDQELTHELPVSEIPKRCEAIYFGAYFFDNQNATDVNIEGIACLIAAGYQVYTALAGYYGEPNWVEMMTTDKHDTAIETMVTFMKDNNISGVFIDLAYDRSETDKECKINALICKIKACDSSLKIGIMRNPYLYTKLGLGDDLDYTLLNPTLDMYMIMTPSIMQDCTANYSSEYGLLPITDTIDGFANLDMVCQGIAASSMDKSKAFIYFSMWVAWTVNNTAQDHLEYPQYCPLSSNSSGGAIYCADTLKMYHDRAEHAKSFFGGIIIGNLDFDYWNDVCGCERYAITNAFIDGWQSK